MSSFASFVRIILGATLYLLTCSMVVVGAPSGTPADSSDVEPSAVIDSPVVVDTTVAIPVVDSAEALPLSVDTVRFESTVRLDNAAPVTDSTNFELYRRQNPTVALFKSMAVPGWGQAANGRYYKAVLFFGMDAFFIASALHHGSKASDYRSQYEQAELIDTRNAYYDLYEDSRTDRNKFTWYAVITTFIAMFDAYVDAHLSGFPAERSPDRLSIEMGPTPEGETRLLVSFRF